MASIVILGAGLTGLSTAYHLERAGFFDYVIYEREERPGGLLRSFRTDGFTFDFTGHLLHINDAYFTAFLNEITSLDHFLAVTRKTAIFSHGVYTDYPFQMNLHGLPPDVIYECIDGFIKRETSRRKPASFYDWVLKYFGRGMGKHFFFPYNSKILAYDVKKVHPAWTGRFVPQTSLEAVIKGAVASRGVTSVGYNSKFYYPKQGGIEFIIRALRDKIQNPIYTDQTAIEIQPQSRRIIFADGSTTRYKKLISTMPLDHLLRMTTSNSRTYDAAAKKLLCNTTINFNLGFNRPELSDKHWVYYPEKKYPFYRLGFWHNINASSVKPGHTAIYGELSYQPTLMPKEKIPALADGAIEAALSQLGLTQHDISVRKDLILNHAYVLYDDWREKNLTTLLATLAGDDMHSIGRFGGWKYSSMQEAVLDGKEMAEKLLEGVGAQRVVVERNSNLVQP